MTATNNPATPPTIDIVSDVMCPWCYIGKRRLERALPMLHSLHIAPTVRWRPFQLDSTLPKSGKPRSQYLLEKFGSPERVASVYGQISDAGKSEGIEFRFDSITVSPNTLDSHRLIHWAGEHSLSLQNDLVELLFSKFFIHGESIGETAVLLDAAEQSGMSTDTLADDLAGDKDINHIRQEIDSMHALGIHGVPCFILNDRHLLSGAQPAESIVDAFRSLTA